MSHMALLTAPDAMWITPFSGPILCIYFRDTFTGHIRINVPAQLGVGHHVVPCLAHIGEESLGVLAHQAIRNLFDCAAYLSFVS